MRILSDTDPLIPILRASENALAAVLRLLADTPGLRVIEDAYGFRFFNPQMPPESMLFRARVCYCSPIQLKIRVSAVQSCPGHQSSQ